jgi:predicted MFS family arabinose efflux permease
MNHSPLSSRQTKLLPVLAYAALISAVVSSLGMLLVPTISHEMNVSVSTGQWMLTINLLVGAVSTPIMGRLSDGPHKKLLLIWALAVILTGSVIAAAAPNFAVFLIGRALQGLAYGIVPVTIALARRYLAEERVSFGISTLSITVSTGLGVGYPLTGMLAEVCGFRSAFGFSALFALSAIVVVSRVVPSGPDETAPRRQFDLPGAILLGVGLAALLTAVSEGSNWGWSSPLTIGCFSGAAAFLVMWSMVELRARYPLINLRVLRIRVVLLANATAIGLGAAMYVALSVASLLAQAPASTGYGIALPLFWAGYVMLPLSVGSFAANRLVRVLSNRISMRILLPLGAGTLAASTLFLWLVHGELWEIMLGMLLFGVGIGMTYAAMPGLIAKTVAAAELGSAVSFNQVLRTVGGSFGSAVSGAVLAAQTGPGLHPAATAINATLSLSALCCAVVVTALVVNHLISRNKAKPAASVRA